MGKRKNQLCRMCLTTSAMLRSIFTIFQNHNLVFIIRDFVKLEIKEDDKLPKMICKSCAVKLIRVRENVSLFMDSDRKLRSRLAEDVDLTDDVVRELRQDGGTKRKSGGRRRVRKKGDEDEEEEEDDEDGDEDGSSTVKKEVTDSGTVKQEAPENHLFEFNDVKEEVIDSSSDEDLPLRILQNVVQDSVFPQEFPSLLVQETIKDEDRKPAVVPALIDQCKEEQTRSDREELAAYSDDLAGSPGNSDSDEYELPKAKKVRSTKGRRPKKETGEVKPKRAYRRRMKKVEIDSEMEEEDFDDEDKDSTFKIEGEQLKEDVEEIQSNSSEEEFTVKKKRGRPKTKKPASADPNTVKRTRKRRAPGTAPPPKDKSVPTMHDFKCYICNSESFGSQKNLIEHFPQHVDRIPYTCKECTMETVTLTRVRTLNSHLKMHTLPVKCDYCDRRYSNASGKYYHLQAFHLGGGAPCQVDCKVCGKTCRSQTALKNHMKYHTTKLKCSKCDMVFNHINNLRYHERGHDENRGFECVICKKVLQTIECYEVHLKQHNQERNHQCHLCSRKFITSSNLILHLKVHAENDNYRPSKSWIEHYTVLSRNPMHFKCNHCDRYNTDKLSNMISHLQAHFKEYECDQCHHKFATAKQLRAHYTTHTGDKPEKCKYCEKVFSTTNNLRIHLKASHPEWTPQQRSQVLVTTTVPEAATATSQSTSNPSPSVPPPPPQPASTPNLNIYESSSSNSAFVGMMPIPQ